MPALDLSQGAIARACANPLQSSFRDFLPRKPYCTDDPTCGVVPRALDTALKRRLIQPNNPSQVHWLTYDIDRPDAYFAAYDGNLPEPTFIAANPANGHAHIAFRLKTPIVISPAGRKEPICYGADIDRGLRRRLDADQGYNGLLIKNPLHPHWKTTWGRAEPYELDELNDWLFPRDKRPEPSIQVTGGLGRNCILFDELRKFSYPEVRGFKKRGDSQAGFHQRLLDVALRLNSEFVAPMHQKEVAGIAKSVSKWTWKNIHLTSVAYSKRQSTRGKAGNKVKWAGHVSVEKTKPWEAEGVSRRTWYYRQKAIKKASVQG